MALNTKMKLCSVEAFTNVTQCGNLEYFMHITRLFCFYMEKILTASAVAVYIPAITTV